MAVLTSQHRQDALNAVAAFRKGTGPNPSETSPVGWAVTRARLATQLTARLNAQDGGFPNQGQTSRCGPALFLYCLLQDRPDLYVKFAIGLWTHGSYIFNAGPKPLTVRPGQGTIKSSFNLAAYRISDLDWMTMGGLSKPDDGDADPGQALTAITYPHSVRDWFAAAGAPATIERFESIAGLGVSTNYIRALLGYWPTHWIVLEINPDMLDKEDAHFWDRHWVVVSEKIPPLFGGKQIAAVTQTGRDLEKLPADVHFDTWGSDRWPLKAGKTFGDFKGDILGGAAFPHIP